MTAAPAVPSNLREAEALLHESGTGGFAEPWQAQAFACAIQLSRQGLFPWTEWVDVFSAEIKAHPQRTDEGSNAAYFRQWLAALETIVTRKGAASAAEIDRRQDAWRQAYLNTPHGKPVELASAPGGAGQNRHAHHHHHDDDDGRASKPVAVSPAVGK
jgi:nitrile hydratase accessory protein